MDRLTAEARKRNMKAVKSRDSDIEILLRKTLWEKDYRYRKNYNKLPGKPDIVFISKKVAIFCDSEFWHGYDWENRKYDIKSNRDFWWDKIESNIERDKRITKELESKGWTVLRFWGNEIKRNTAKCLEQIEYVLKEQR